jgi:hypothetical protein
LGSKENRNEGKLTAAMAYRHIQYGGDPQSFIFQAGIHADSSTLHFRQDYVFAGSTAQSMGQKSKKIRWLCLL